MYEAAKSTESKRFSWDHQLLDEGEDLIVEDVPAHLCRGISLAYLFAGFGRILRLRPDELPRDEQTALHLTSAPVSEVSFFLSHCWASKGVQKYLALVVHFQGARAVLVATLAALGCFLTTLYLVELPAFGTKKMHEWGVTFPVYHWALYAGLLAGWGFLLFGGVLRCGKAGFLDCSCIHQTDPEQKSEGIKLLPGYVKCSKEFVVLWDELYFTRMWCTYELGLFVASNPKSPISVLPLRMTSGLVKMHVYHVVCFAGFLLMWPILPGTPGFLAATAGAAFPCYFLIGRKAVKMAEQSLQLEAQLDTFDAARAECAVASDKVALVEDLNKRFEDRGGISHFNRLVRTSIKQRVLKGLISRRTILSYRSIMIATCPAIPFFFSCQLSYVGLPWMAQLCHGIFAVTHTFAVFPGALALVAVLAARPVLESVEREEERQAVSIWRLLLCSLVGMVIVVAFNTLGYLVPVGLVMGAFPDLSETPWHGPALGTAVDILFAMPAWWFFGFSESEARLKKGGFLLSTPDGHTRGDQGCADQHPVAQT